MHCAGLLKYFSVIKYDDYHPLKQKRGQIKLNVMYGGFFFNEKHHTFEKYLRGLDVVLNLYMKHSIA